MGRNCSHICSNVLLLSFVSAFVLLAGFCETRQKMHKVGLILDCNQIFFFVLFASNVQPVEYGCVRK